MTGLAAALAALVLAGPTLAATPVKIGKTWTGRMPVAVPALVQSSVASKEAWASVWATCQMKGPAPEVDFDKQLVLVAVRRSSAVRFDEAKLDNGNLATSVVATPDAPNHQTCALALVSRAGIKTVNGASPGK